MNEKVHRYLDGEVQQGEPTPEELQEIAACEDLIRETRETYRSIEVPDLTARVMARLPAGGANSSVLNRFIQNTLGWMWTPRPIPFRPVFGILALAAVYLILVFPKSSANRDTDRLATKVFVQFRLDASQASEVRLAGSFTAWKPAYTLEQVSPGVWSILIPLEPGVHDYAFVIDGGEWIADPAAPAVDDGFGGVNSRLSVLLPNGDSRL